MKKYIPLLLTLALAATATSACNITQGTETPIPIATTEVPEETPSPTPSVEPSVEPSSTPFVFPTPASVLPLTSYYPEGLPAHIQRGFLEYGGQLNPDWGFSHDPELVIGVVNGTDVAYCAIPYGGAQSMPFDDVPYTVGESVFKATGCVNGVSLSPTEKIGIYDLDIGDGTSYQVSIDPEKLSAGTYFFAVRPDGFVADGQGIVTSELANHLTTSASGTSFTLAGSGCPLVPTPAPQSGLYNENQETLALAAVTSKDKYSLNLSE